MARRRPAKVRPAKLIRMEVTDIDGAKNTYHELTEHQAIMCRFPDARHFWRLKAMDDERGNVWQCTSALAHQLQEPRTLCWVKVHR